MKISRPPMRIFMFAEHTLVDEDGNEVRRLMAPTNCNGLFPSHEEWWAIANEVAEFYNSLVPSEIAASNELRLSRQEARQNQQAKRVSTPKPIAGYVYLLEGGGYYKIGLSKNVYRRWRELSPKLPFEIEIISFIATEDMHKLEAALHELYARNEQGANGFSLMTKMWQYSRSLPMTDFQGLASG